MIYTLALLGAEFQEAFHPAGEPDLSVFSAEELQQAEERRTLPGETRSHYIGSYDPRLVLTTVGTPLEQWEGGGLVMVGSVPVIRGEFAAQRRLIGQKGLRLTLKPLAALRTPADSTLASGADLLDQLNFQQIDQARIDHVQERLARRIGKPLL